MILNDGVIARVRLVEASGSQTFERSVALDPMGVKCRIGTGPNADIQLPRDRYLDLGSRHLAILFLPSGIAFEVYHAHTPCRVDGKAADKVQVRFGEHVLDIGAHRFKMFLETSPRTE